MDLSTESIISIVGAIITVLSMLFTIYQAIKARKYKDQVSFETRKIHLYTCKENLEKVQDLIRNLPAKDSKVKRGYKVSEIISETQRFLEKSINLISQNGEDKTFREQLVQVQEFLNTYEKNYNSNKKGSDAIYDLKSDVHDSISSVNEKLSTRGKND